MKRSVVLFMCVCVRDTGGGGGGVGACMAAVRACVHCYC